MNRKSRWYYYQTAIEMETAQGQVTHCCSNKNNAKMQSALQTLHLDQQDNQRSAIVRMEEHH